MTPGVAKADARQKADHQPSTPAVAAGAADQHRFGVAKKAKVMERKAGPPLLASGRRSSSREKTHRNALRSPIQYKE